MKRISVAALVFAALAGSAQAADPLTVAVDAATFDWSGVYAGVYVGAGTGTVFTNTVPPGAAADINVTGLLGGVDVGVNFQTGNIVLGVEADAAVTNIGGSLVAAACAGTCTERTNFLGSIRGRAGLALDKVLLFATAGLAVLNETSGTVPPPGGTTGTFTGTYTGYVVGAGAEFAVSDQLSLKAEYNFNAFNTLTAPAGTLSALPVTVRPVIHAVKIGANWHF
jgi:outer membrane immunogenic protein